MSSLHRFSEMHSARSQKLFALSLVVLHSLPTSRPVLRRFFGLLSKLVVGQPRNRFLQQAWRRSQKFHLYQWKYPRKLVHWQSIYLEVVRQLS